MKQLPRVVIVGRTNVGKSTLFNRLSVAAKSITFDFHGVTRDFIKDVVCWQDHCFELIDTGGISLRKTQDIILSAVRAQALDVLKQAELILFVVDASIGLLPEDREIAQLCHTLGKKVIILPNKSDTTQASSNMHEFQRLGFSQVIPISAIHATGMGDLLEAIVANTPLVSEVAAPEPSCKIMLLGKPNVGKSSLMNLLLKQERSIVTPQAGTTREAISEKVTFYQQDILVTDTPGVRRKRAIDEPLETLMVKKTFGALEDANIVLLLIDGSEGVIADQELKLAFYAFEHYKAVIILYNKNDLVDENTQKELDHSLELYEHFLKKVPQLTISCKTGKNIGKILPLVQEVWQRYSQTFNDDELTMLFKKASQDKPLYHQTKQLNVFRVKQLQASPITLLMVVNEPDWFGPSQTMFFENVVRSNYDLKGVPIKFLFKKRNT